MNGCKNAIKVGLLGGTFDPIHFGHIDAARLAIKEFDLDRVELIPTYNSYQKFVLSSPQDRCSMIKLAIKLLPKITLNECEINRKGITYTVDTICYLKQSFKEIQYYWILGSDQINNFCTWKNWKDLLRMIHIVVIQRSSIKINIPIQLKIEQALNDKFITILPKKPRNISSSIIREMVKNNQSISGLTNHHVINFIYKNRLYQS